MSEQTTITLRNRLSELERVAVTLTQLAQRHRLSSKVAFDLGLAVDEILTNIIRYAYDGPGEHEIVVRVACDRTELTVEVEDDGRTFNPLEVAVPDTTSSLAERPIGGLGLHLVRSVMDRLQYQRQGGKNVLQMTKTLEPQPADFRPAAAALDISETRTGDGIVVLSIAGRVDGRNAVTLEEKLLGTVDTGATGIVLDLADLEYFGSAGVRALLLAAKRLRGVASQPPGGASDAVKSRRQLALAAPKDFIRTLLEVAGLASIVTIHPDRARAIAHLRSSAGM